MNITAKAKDSIIERVDISEAGCWEYKLKLRSNGYARITFMRESWYAHRLSYFAFNGDIPEGLDVCHKCDNRKCCNPNHLFLGTRKDNMNDCVNKNRQAKGFSLPQTKLSMTDKAKISEMAKSGIKYKYIARKFDITPQMAGKIGLKAGVTRR